MIEAIRSLVRPIITFALTGLLIYMAVTKVVEAKDVLTVVGIIIAFWFAGKASEKNNT